MSGPSRLWLRNRQRRQKINLRLLRRITLTVLTELLPPRPFDLCLHLVSTQTIARLNQQFLQHPGPTDVITFNYSETPKPQQLCGEIFICLEVARQQAPRFRASWQAELVRYVVHGLLHLCGFDDHDSKNRQLMKRHENRLLRKISNRFPLSKLRLASKVSL